MAAWIIAALAPGLALCCAAALAEQAARQRRWPSRWIWLGAMAGSIVLPAVGPAIPELALLRLPSLLPGWSPDAAATTRQMGAIVQAHDAVLARSLWVALSLATLALLVGAASLLQHRARRWRRMLIDGREACVAPEAGPAVFGWLRPRIVLPAWLAEAPSRQRDLAMAHEQSHLDARDPQLLGLALALLVIMPWNPLLWWQLRRLRHAIEVDCDARVLRRGHDLMDYGETLLTLGLRRSQRYGLMAASDASQSLLERRIRIMSSQPNHWSRLTACMLVGLAVCAAALAAELAPARAAHAATATPPVPPVPVAPSVPSAQVPAVAPIEPVAPIPPVAAIAPDAPAPLAENESDDVPSAKAEAEEAAEHAAELKNDTEEAERGAQEAKRDAEAQQAQAEEAKREAEAAQAEAIARKQAAEAAARAAQSSSRVN